MGNAMVLQMVQKLLVHESEVFVKGSGNRWYQILWTRRSDHGLSIVLYELRNRTAWRLRVLGAFGSIERFRQVDK